MDAKATNMLGLQGSVGAHCMFGSKYSIMFGRTLFRI